MKKKRLLKADTINPEIKQRIKQLRSVMLIHSCLYYELNDSVMSDHEWQRFADELTELQTKYPDECAMNFYDQWFENWDGSTGYHLPLRDPWVYSKAQYISKLYKGT